MARNTDANPSVMFRDGQLHMEASIVVHVYIYIYYVAKLSYCVIKYVFVDNFHPILYIIDIYLYREWRNEECERAILQLRVSCICVHNDCFGRNLY